jgi:hypothetical protein
MFSMPLVWQRVGGFSTADLRFSDLPGHLKQVRHCVHCWKSFKTRCKTPHPQPLSPKRGEGSKVKEDVGNVIGVIAPGGRAEFSLATPEGLRNL